MQNNRQSINSNASRALYRPVNQLQLFLDSINKSKTFKNQLKLIKNFKKFHKYKNEILFEVIKNNNSNDVKIVEYLIHTGASVLYQEERTGNTVLHTASTNNNIENIEAILYTEQIKGNKKVVSCPKTSFKGRNALLLKNREDKYPKDCTDTPYTLIKEEIKSYLMMVKEISFKNFSQKLSNFTESFEEEENNCKDIVELLKFCFDDNNITELIIALVKQILQKEKLVGDILAREEKENGKRRSTFIIFLMLLNQCINNFNGDNQFCENNFKSMKMKLRKMTGWVSIIFYILMKIACYLNNREAATLFENVLKEELLHEKNNFKKLCENCNCYQVDQFLHLFRKYHQGHSNNELPSSNYELAISSYELASGNDEVARSNNEEASDYNEEAGSNVEVASSNVEVSGDSVARSNNEVAGDSEENEEVGSNVNVASSSDEVPNGSSDEVGSSNNGVAIGNAEVASDNAEIANRSDEVASDRDEVASGSDEVANGSDEVASGSNEVGSNNDEVASGSDEVAGDSDEVASDSDDVASGNNEEASSNDEVARSNNEVAGNSEASEEVGSNDEVASSSDEVANGSSDEVGSSNNRVAIENDEVASGNAEVTNRSDEVASGSDEAASGSNEVASGSNEVACGSDEVASGSNEVASSNDEVASGRDEVECFLNKPYNNFDECYLHNFVSNNIIDKCIIEVLIQHGAKLTVEDKFQWIPLHYAAMNYTDNSKIIDMLLNTKHKYSGECLKKGTCKCGAKSLESNNLVAKTPKYYANHKGYMLLNEKEILYKAKQGLIDEESINKYILNPKEGKTVFDGFHRKLLQIFLDQESLNLATCVIVKRAPSILRDSYRTSGKVKKFMDIVEYMKTSDPVSFNIDSELLSKDNLKNLIAIGNKLGSYATLNRILMQFKNVYRNHNDTINLKDLKLQRIEPSFIAHIQNEENRCKELWLSKNYLKKLPSFVNLTYVTKLLLDAIGIENVDAAIFNLPRLSVLKLSKNKIKQLPEYIEWSDTLRLLHLDDNKLYRLPMCISNSFIKWLYINNNDFQSVPIQICDMKMLKILDLSNNKKIISLPKEMGKLSETCDVRLENMKQISRDSALQMVLARNKYYGLKRNQEMNVNLIGDSDAIKRKIINCLFGVEENCQREEETESLSTQIQGASFHGPLTFDSKKKLHIINYPSKVECHLNHYLFTDLSLYIYVISNQFDVEVLEKWFNYLSTYCHSDQRYSIAFLYDVDDLSKKKKIITDQIITLIKSKTRWSGKIHMLDLLLFNSNDLVNKTKIKRFIQKNALKIKMDTKQAILGKVYAHYSNTKENLKILNLDRVSLLKEEIPIADTIMMNEALNKTKSQVQCCRRREKLLNFNNNVLNETVNFLNRTGVILHVKDNNCDSSDVYFIDRKSLNAGLLSYINDPISLQCKGHMSHHKQQHLEVIPGKNLEDKKRFLRFLTSNNICFKTIGDNLQIASYLSIDAEKFQKIESIDKSFEYRRVFMLDLMKFDVWIKILSRIMFYFDKKKLIKDEKDIFKYIEYWQSGFIYHLKKTAFIAVLLFNAKKVFPDSISHAIKSKESPSTFQTHFQKYKKNELIQDNVILVIIKHIDNEIATDFISYLSTQIKHVLSEYKKSNLLENDATEYAVCINCFNNHKIKLEAIDKNFTKLLENGWNDSTTTHHRCKSSIIKIEIKHLYPEFFLPKLPLVTNLEEIRKIGDGSEGKKVFEMKVELNGKFYNCAVKRFATSDMHNCLDDYQLFRREVIMFDGIQYSHNVACSVGDAGCSIGDVGCSIGDRKHHKNIAQLYAIKLSPLYFDMVMDLANTNLYNIIFFKGDQAICMNEMKLSYMFRFAQQIVNALDYLHTLEVTHNDIKSQNVVIYDGYVAKLCDFGSAVHSGLSVFDGTTYKPPEMECNHGSEVNRASSYNNKSIDIWGFAIILYEMIFRRLFFDNTHILDNFKIKHRPNLKVGRKDVETLCMLTEIAWDNEPEMRPTARDIKAILLSAAFQLYIKDCPTTDEAGEIKCISTVSSNVLLYVQGDYLYILDVENSKHIHHPIHYMKGFEIQPNEVFDLKEIYYVGEGILDCLILEFLFCYTVNDRLHFRKRKFKRKELLRRNEYFCVMGNNIESSDEFKVFEEFHFQPKKDAKFKKLLPTYNESFLCCYATTETPVELYSDVNNEERHQGEELQLIQGYVEDLVVLDGILVILLKTNEQTQKTVFYKMHQPYIHRMNDIDEIERNLPIKNIFLCKRNLFLGLENKNYFYTINFDISENLDSIQIHKERKIYFKDQKIQDITCICHVYDTIWVGTSIGYIYIYKLQEYDTCKFLRYFKPYESGVLYLFAIQYNPNEIHIGSYGAILNGNLFDINEGNNNHIRLSANIGKETYQEKLKKKLFGEDNMKSRVLFWLAKDSEELLLLSS